jgi:UDP-glucose 4-epimerase
MKVLVTGATGFLGKHLVQRLLKLPQVREIVGTTLHAERHVSDIWFGTRTPCWQLAYCNLEYEQRTADLMLRYQPDVVFHLAGRSRVREDPCDPTAVTRANVLSTHNLLAHCRPQTRFIYASSAAVYGSDVEGYDDGVIPLSPQSVYAASKVAGEALVEAYTSTGKVRGLSLRLANVVGKGKSYGLLHDVLTTLEDNDATLTLLGDSPGPCRQYLHVDDAVEAMVKLGFQNVYHAVNVASPGLLSVQAVVENIMFVYGRFKELRWAGKNANWVGDTNNCLLDTFVALAHGWQPQHSTSTAAVRQAVRDILEIE